MLLARPAARLVAMPSFQGAGRRGCQFSFACDGSMRRGREAGAWLRAQRVAACELNVISTIGSLFWS